MLIFVSTIVCLYLLPVLLIWRGWLSAKFRLVLLFAVFAISVLLSYLFEFSLIDLGLRLDNLSDTFGPYVLFTVSGIVATLWLARFLKRLPDANWRQDKHFQFLFIPISFAQEFLYRGFFWPLAFLVSDNFWFVVLLNTLLFAWLHVIFPNQPFSLALAIIVGLALAIMYWFYPNLVWLSLSHATLNFVAVLFGFFNSDYQPTSNDFANSTDRRPSNLV
jgi:membrane protease YdiL (CAAX protease family)